MRLLSAVFGLALIGGVTWLGILSGADARFVIWFGIASAIAAPIGIAAIAFALKGRQQDALEDLRRIPEIQRLIAEAKTKEEQLRLLKEERRQLQEIIATESRRQTLESRRAAAEGEAKRLLKEIRILDSELEQFEGVVSAPVSEALRELRKLVKARSRGDIVLQIGGRSVVMERDMFLALPLGGLLFQYFRAIELLMTEARKRKLREPKQPSQHNAGAIPHTRDLPASETPSAPASRD